MSLFNKPLFILGIAGVILHLSVSYEYYRFSWSSLILGSYPLLRGFVPHLLVGVESGVLAGPLLYDTRPYGLLSGLIAGEVLALALGEGDKRKELRRALEWWIGFSLGWVAFTLIRLTHFG